MKIKDYAWKFIEIKIKDDKIKNDLDKDNR